MIDIRAAALLVQGRADGDLVAALVWQSSLSCGAAGLWVGHGGFDEDRSCGNWWCGKERDDSSVCEKRVGEQGKNFARLDPCELQLAYIECTI